MSAPFYGETMMAEEPRAMTQEEIDNLFANLSTSMPAIPKVEKNAPPPEEEAEASTCS